MPDVVAVRRAMVRTLRRCTQPDQGAPLSLHWGQRLGRLVAEATPGSSLVLTTTSDGESLQVSLEALAPPGWGAAESERLLDEAVALLEDVASFEVVEVQQRVTAPPDHVLRVMPRGGGEGVRDLGFTPEVASPATLWATPRAHDPAELARLLLEHPGIVLVQSVQSLDEDEVDRARDSLWQRIVSEPLQIDDALGTPLRVTATLVAPAGSGPVPLRLREHVRGWFTVLDLDDADDVPAPARGTVAPEGVAAGLLRLPVAVRDTFPGVEVEPIVVPLESTTRDEEGIRVGCARTLGGDDLDVRLSPGVMERHVHVLGETGTGKSTALTRIAVETAAAGEGLLLLDPHGATVDRVLRELPASAADRTWVIRCGDPHHPVRLNPFAVGDPDLQDLLISDLLDVFQALFDPRQEGIVGPRFQHIMRHALTTLAEVRGERASLLDVPRLLSDPELRRAVVARVTNPDVKAFWRNDIDSNRSNELNEVVSWVSSKFTAFASNRAVAEMLATGEDSFDPAVAMKDRRVILVDLGKGSVGVMGSRVLGLTYLLRFWTASLTRESPDPFTVLVDEAHSLSALTLPSILAEGRKFGMRAVIANQYLDQLDPRLMDAVRGSVGTRICFRVGQADARELSLTLGPEFEADDLTSLPRMTAAVRRADEGLPERPFTLVLSHSDGVRADEATVRAIEARSLAELVEPLRDARRLELSDLESEDDAPTTSEDESTDDEALLEWLPRRRGAGPAATDSARPLPRPDGLLLLPLTVRRPDVADGQPPDYVVRALASQAARSAGDELSPVAVEWCRLIGWAGLGDLDGSRTAALSRACEDEQGSRVGERLLRASPADLWEQVETLFEQGADDPLVPIRGVVDVPGILTSEKFRLLDELVAHRDAILTLTGTPASPESDAAPGLLAERARALMARGEDDTSPPDDDWAEAAWALVTAVEPASPSHAAVVATAAVAALPDARPFGALLAHCDDLVERAPADTSTLNLAVQVHRYAPWGSSASAERWRVHLLAARELARRGLAEDALRAYDYVFSLDVVGAPVPQLEIAQASNDQADLLEAAGAWRVAAVAWARALTSAHGAGDQGRAVRDRAEDGLLRMAARQSS